MWYCFKYFVDANIIPMRFIHVQYFICTEYMRTYNKLNTNTYQYIQIYFDKGACMYI